MVTAALALAACTTQTTGSPTTQGAEPGSIEPTHSSTTEPTRTTAIDPCELLTEPALKTLGVTGIGKPGKITGVTSCDWRVNKESAGGGYTISVGYYPHLGLGDIVTSSRPASVSVGKHKAVQALGPGGIGCLVGIEVTTTSRVDVMAVGGKPEDLCAPALDAARLVEPRLP
ncbi:DUF3558 domain-containing protein [Actinokineospora inagensis]|uniref:DUF3558 domain-containing protein n=1 Tax=Actinokineospora inagensis TaxID=103730 RepID=UPI00146FA063|nr:DUF3558 domain-containing protein [Actinokineospora inagensis]